MTADGREEALNSTHVMTGVSSGMIHVSPTVCITPPANQLSTAPVDSRAP